MASTADEPEFRWRDCPKYAWSFVCMAFLRLQTRWADFRIARMKRKLAASDIEIAMRVAHLPREERRKFYAEMDAEIAQVKKDFEEAEKAGKPPPRG